uniref:MICOS complex subunit MIC13 n=1 Tax=Zonotrichia albicollis TaxID=44394 RepID=A0A8D2NEV9_ZONAL
MSINAKYSLPIFPFVGCDHSCKTGDCTSCRETLKAVARCSLGCNEFLVKGGLAGAAVYVAYDQGLLGSGIEGAEALKKAQETLPPAIQEWTDYLGWEVRALPATPKIDFSLSASWNKGVHTVMGALSAAPSRACEYTVEGWKYVKDLMK